MTRKLRHPQPMDASYWQAVREACDPEVPLACRYPWCSCNPPVPAPTDTPERKQAA